MRRSHPPLPPSFCFKSHRTIRCFLLPDSVLLAIVTFDFCNLWPAFLSFHQMTTTVMMIWLMVMFTQGSMVCMLGSPPLSQSSRTPVHTVVASTSFQQLSTIVHQHQRQQREAQVWRRRPLPTSSRGAGFPTHTPPATRRCLAAYQFSAFCMGTQFTEIWFTESWKYV